MTPVFMQRHDDCFRACIASIMDRSPEDVPHFAEGGVGGNIMIERADRWLDAFGLAVFVTSWTVAEDSTINAVLRWVGAKNDRVHYILGGTTATGVRHAVVCFGNQIVHDPAPVPQHMYVDPDRLVDVFTLAYRGGLPLRGGPNRRTTIRRIKR